MKRLIITGVTEGLGFELSELFLSEGVEVIGISRSEPKNKVTHIAADLATEEGIKKVVDTVKEKYNDFDCIINCAGVLAVQKPHALSYEENDRLLKLNTLAPMQLVSGLFHEIKKNEADVVNVGSTVSFKAYADQCSYGASKWAVRGLNENLQLELKKTACRVIGFYPGGFKSKLFEKATGTEVNLDGFMEPKDLAQLMIQLLKLPKSLEVSEIVVNRK